MAIGTALAVGLGAAGAGLFGSKMQADAAKDGAKATSKAADQSTALQRDIFNQNRADMAPWRETGANALSILSDELLNPYRLEKHAGKGKDNYWTVSGLLNDAGYDMRFDGVSAAQKAAAAASGGGNLPGGVRTRFQSSPGYQFAVDQANQATERRAAAGGLRMSGALMDRLSEQNTGYANQEYGNWLNRISGIAGTGQTATSNIANMGTQFGQQAGQNMLAAGQAQAQGAQGQADAWNAGINGAFNAYGAYRGGFFNPMGGA